MVKWKGYLIWPKENNVRYNGTEGIDYTNRIRRWIRFSVHDRVWDWWITLVTSDPVKDQQIRMGGSILLITLSSSRICRSNSI